MNILTYLNSLRPALPLSTRKDEDGAFLPLSNSELSRALKQKAITINGTTDWTHDEEAPCHIWQLIFYRKSKSRCTLV